MRGWNLFARSQTIHVCYAIATDGEPRYVESVAASARALKQLYPSAKITVLTDDRSFSVVTQLLKRYRLARKVRSVGAYAGNMGARSRFVKTQVRQFIVGDFLFLDADAIPVRPFDELFQEHSGQLCAAIDRSPKEPDGNSLPPWAERAFERLGWSYPKPFYLNGGVVLWPDTPLLRQLGKLWHENWRRFYESSDDFADQPSFNYSIYSLGISPEILHDRYNARVALSADFAVGASIYHFYASDENLSGRMALEQLLIKLRAGGTINLGAVDAALADGYREWSSRETAKGRVPDQI
jgi:hypothetical protein